MLSPFSLSVEGCSRKEGEKEKSENLCFHHCICAFSNTLTFLEKKKKKAQGRNPLLSQARLA